MTYRFRYLSYICHMTLIYFPTKLIFYPIDSYRVGIRHPSKLPIRQSVLERQSGLRQLWPSSVSQWPLAQLVQPPGPRTQLRH